MPFIDIPMLESHAKFVPLHDSEPASVREPEHTVRVTDLTRHIRVEDLHSLVRQYMRIEKTTIAATADQLIRPPTKVMTHPLKGFWEHVSDLNGIAITTAFKHTTVEDILKNPDERAVWFAEQAARHEAEDSGYNFRWLQLRQQRKNRFGWLIGFLDRAVVRLAGEVTQEGKIAKKDLQHEQELRSWVTIPVPNRDKPEPIEIVGRADIVFDPKDGSRATIWEIKFVQSFKLEYVAQIVQYGLLWADEHPDAPFPRLLLFNVLDGERWEISTTKKQALGFVMGMFRAKRARTKLTDDEFRRQYEETSDEAQAIVDRIPQPIKA